MESRGMQIDLIIDELVLNGFELTATDRAELVSIVSIELERLLASNLDGGRIEESLKPAGNFPRVQAASIELSARSNPDELGAQIAGAIFGGLQR